MTGDGGAGHPVGEGKPTLIPVLPLECKRLSLSETFFELLLIHLSGIKPIG